MKQLVKDVTPVIFGILIALLINNWNENRKDKKYLNQIYAALHEELAETSRDIEDNLPKQQRLLDSLQANLNKEHVSVLDVILKAGGIHGPRIRNYSWKAISSSRIELIDFDMLATFSELDESKKNLEYKQQKILDFVYDNVKNTSPEKKEIFFMINQEIVGSQRGLKIEIDELKEKIKPKLIEY